MKTRVMLLAVVAAVACSPERPSKSVPVLVTLGTFEGEVDPVAGTFSVRSTGTTPGGAPGTALAITEGASGVTIANNGTPTQGSGTGTCAGFTVLSSTVRIARGSSNTGFAGGLYAEIQTITGTGGEACNSDATPTGLSATKGLWSYGTVRADVTTSDRTWAMKVTSGQKTTFTGRIVGVAGVTFAYGASLLQANNVYSYNPIIAYAREKMAYAAAASAAIVYVNLDGTWASTVTDAAGEIARGLSFQQGATASDDLLWYATPNRVGVVYQGTAYSAALGNTVAQVAADPTTANRAWVASLGGNYLKSVTFDTGAKTFTFSASSINTVNAPKSIAIGAGASPLIYVSSTSQTWGFNVVGANWLKAWTMDGVAQTVPALTTGNCDIPYTLIRGPDDKIWFAFCKDFDTCGYCAYEHGAGTPYQRTTGAGSGAIAVARSVTGAGDSIWGMVWNGGVPGPGDTLVHQASEVTAGATAFFKVDYPEGTWPTQVPSYAGSPAVRVGGTDHPAYLWVTTQNGILRMQP